LRRGVGRRHGGIAGRLRRGLVGRRRRGAIDRGRGGLGDPELVGADVEPRVDGGGHVIGAGFASRQEIIDPDGGVEDAIAERDGEQGLLAERVAAHRDQAKVKSPLPLSEPAVNAPGTARDAK
jgi:hypothetical protein